MDTGIPSSPQPDPQTRTLRMLVHCLAVSVLILTGTFFVYLYRQVVLMRKSTTDMVQYLNNSEVPEVVDRVRDRLDDYRRQDPNFTPIFVKYFGTNPPPEEPSASRNKIAPIDTNLATSTLPPNNEP